MKFCILGWYGTETMGDRAILDGILSVINEVDKKATVLLGSLFSFFSKRTLLEEKEVFKNTAPDISIRIFDSKDRKIRSNNVLSADMVIMGGGPLMDIEELYIIEDCFKTAKRHNIPTVVMGCGLGPLYRKRYIRCVGRIFKLSIAISLRDRISQKIAINEYGSRKEYLCLGDPAVISIENYKKRYKRSAEPRDYISVSLRSFPKVCGSSYISDEDIKHFLFDLSAKFGEVRLVPMHTFIGGDDRRYYAELLYLEKHDNIIACHDPMNLSELYKCYIESTFCIGMRYHSVVMQTILNGNNYVLDYTDPNSGKIVGFIDKVDSCGFYKDRIVHFQEPNAKQELCDLLSDFDHKKGFQYEYSNMKQDYVRWIKEILG